MVWPSTDLQKHCGSSPLPYKVHRKGVFPYRPILRTNFWIFFTASWKFVDSLAIATESMRYFLTLPWILWASRKFPKFPISSSEKNNNNKKKRLTVVIISSYNKVVLNRRTLKLLWLCFILHTHGQYFHQKTFFNHCDIFRIENISPWAWYRK